MSPSNFTPNYNGGPNGMYDAQAAFYGRDIMFAGGLSGNIVVGANGDYVTVEGIENLRRSLMRRLCTRPGEYRLRPDYGAGLPAYVKKRFTPSLQAQLISLVRTQVLRDRRIDKITVLTLTQDFTPGSDEPVITVTLLAEALGLPFTPKPFTISRDVQS